MSVQLPILSRRAFLVSWISALPALALGQAPPAPAPRVLIDEGHNQVGGYPKFAALLAENGFNVGAHRGKFTTTSLAGATVLVIVNPFPEPRATLLAKSREEKLPIRWSTAANRSAFSEDEVVTLRDWVSSGGALLLVFNHAPHGNTVGTVARAFGVETLNVETTDSTHLDPPRTPIPPILFTRRDSLLGTHPVLTGVDSIVTYGGGSMRAPTPASVLLRVPANRIDRTYDGSTATYRTESVAGKAQGVALTFGRGRVVVLGEAQVLGAPVEAQDGDVAGGIDNPRLGNRRFALNVARWLVAQP